MKSLKKQMFMIDLKQNNTTLAKEVAWITQYELETKWGKLIYWLLAFEQEAVQFITLFQVFRTYQKSDLYN